MVLAGALGETYLSSWLSLEGLQKLPREGEKKIIKAETVPCVGTWGGGKRVGAAGKSS